MMDWETRHALANLRRECMEFRADLDAMRKTVGTLSGGSNGVAAAGMGESGGTDVAPQMVMLVPPDDGANYWNVRWDAENECWVVGILPDSVVGFGGSGLPSIQNERIGTTNWYKVANAPSGSTTGIFNVIVHVKRRVKVGSNGIAPCIHVSATAPGEEEPGTEPANRSAGDVFSCIAARCETTEETDGETEETVYNHVVVARINRSQLQITPQANNDLELYWACPAVGSSGWQTFTPHVEGQNAPPYTISATLEDTALPASGLVSVYYQVECTTTYEPSVATTNNQSPSVVSVRIYILQDGVVQTDSRLNLAQQPFFL